LTFHVNEGDSTAPVYAEEEEDGEDHEFETTPLHFMVTPSQKSLMRSSFDPSDWSAGFTEMLPAGKISNVVALLCAILCHT
jgi:hypothetical protein